MGSTQYRKTINFCGFQEKKFCTPEHLSICRGCGIPWHTSSLLCPPEAGVNELSGSISDRDSSPSEQEDQGSEGEDEGGLLSQVGVGGGGGGGREGC